MKVMVILHKDVYNIPTYHVVKEMLNRNYEIDCYAVFMSHNHLRMFDDLKVGIKNISELTPYLIDEYDFIYSSVTLEVIPYVFDIKKYIFTFSTAFMDENINYGDYTFTQRDFGLHLQDYYYALDINNEIKSKPGLVVGNPKFDEDLMNLEKVDEKQILFIDAGHFPFGKEGKKEEAKMLVDIAQNFPEYNVIIKPRFLREDLNVTHRNKTHLYDAINEITNNNVPKNLHCLCRHIDLEKIVRESSLIITPDLTTSYLDIARYDKRGLIASGIPSEYTVVHNKNHVRRFRNIENRSGLCVNYKEICQYIPKGKKTSKEHIIEMGLNQRNVSKKMVDTMEKIYLEYISADRYPSCDSNSYISFENVMSLRYIKSLFSIYEIYEARIELLDFYDIDSQLREYCKNEKIMGYDEYIELREEITKKVNDIIISEGETLMQEDINRGYYLQALYENNAMEKYHDKKLEDDALYCYLWGKYFANEKKEYLKSIEFFKKYFELVENNEYEKTLADMKYYKESATYWIAFCYYHIQEYDIAKEYFQKCEELADNGHRKAREYIKKIEKTVEEDKICR